MENDFVIILFKNKKKRKIIKHYKSQKKAFDKFKELINQSDEILFNKKVENAEECSYELGLLTNTTKTQKSLFLTDDLGRNIPVNFDDPNYVFLDIKKYKVEELIFDWQKQDKISFNQLLKDYCNPNTFKSIFTVNNKICIQVDENLSLFSLKDKDESERFLSVFEDYFIDNKRLDAMFVKDVSSAQRKWIYNVLVDRGFDKKRLYRLKTTFSKR